VCPAVVAPPSAARADAQPVFTGTEIFPPKEFAARRAKVMEKIGDGVAILQGTTERPGEQPLRQNNQFFYLTGVVEPRAIVAIDGRTKKTTLYLLPQERAARAADAGPALSPGPTRRRRRGSTRCCRATSSPSGGGLRARAARAVHAVQARSPRRGVRVGSGGAVAHHQSGPLGRPRLARRSVHPEAEGDRAGVHDRGPRSDRRRAAARSRARARLP
jgi:hypothetical protein